MALKVHWGDIDQIVDSRPSNADNRCSYPAFQKYFLFMRHMYTPLVTQFICPYIGLKEALLLTSSEFTGPNWQDRELCGRT